jgi:uroporphyrinogen-III synthase
MGLRAVAAPLFTIRAVPWDPPEPAAFDGLLLTSANAARCGGAGLKRFLHLPCYTAGEASAAAAREAGFREVKPGAGTAADAANAMAAYGHSRILHLCGRDHVPIDEASLSVETRTVYAADGVYTLPEAAIGALRERAVTVLHSARAARLFAALVPDRQRLRVIAISQSVAGAAGEGWRAKAVATEPRDAALLELAAKLWQTECPSD